MEILILTPKGETVKMSTRERESVIDLKKRISERLFMAPDLQRMFFFHGRVLDDKNGLDQLAIEDKSVITLVEGLRGSGMRIFAKTIDDMVTEIDVYPTETVLSLKKKIDDKLLINRDFFRLFYQGGMLHDEKKLEDYSIKDGSVIDVIPTWRFSGMRIFAKTIDDMVTEIEVYPTDTVLSLKKKIEEKLAIEHDLQRLTYQGCMLDDEKKIDDYLMTDLSVINVVESLRGSGMRIIFETINGRATEMEIEPSKTFLDLKKKIEKKFFIRWDLQRLTYQGRMLHDDKKLEDYSIKDGSVINFVIDRSRLFVIRIFAKTIDDIFAEIEVNPTDTVLTLKKKIEEKLAIDEDLQRLTYQGCMLDNDKKIEDYRIENRSVINVVERLRPTLSVYVKASNGKGASLAYDGKETVLDLKKKIYWKSSIVPDLQVLIYRGDILEDEKKMSDFPGSFNPVIHLIEAESKKILVRTFDGGTIIVEMGGTKTVRDLKKRIATKLSLTTEVLNLVFQDMVLEDDQMIDRLNILKNSIISVNFKKRNDAIL